MFLSLVFSPWLSGADEAGMGVFLRGYSWAAFRRRVAG